MLRVTLSVITCLVAACAHASEAEPSDDGAEQAPVRPGIRDAPGSSPKPLADPGIVIEPPRTDPSAVKTPPRNIDPSIDDATGEIDKRTREKSQEQQKLKK